MQGDFAGLAQKNHAILAINGDYCSKNRGVVVRDGIQHRSEEYKEVLVMYVDGSMKTFTSQEFDLDTEKNKGLYQVWTFGPTLIKDGVPCPVFRYHTEDYR